MKCEVDGRRITFWFRYLTPEHPGELTVKEHSQEHISCPPRKVLLTQERGREATRAVQAVVADASPDRVVLVSLLGEGYSYYSTLETVPFNREDARVKALRRATAELQREIKVAVWETYQARRCPQQELRLKVDEVQAVMKAGHSALFGWMERKLMQGA